LDICIFQFIVILYFDVFIPNLVTSRVNDIVDTAADVIEQLKTNVITPNDVEFKWSLMIMSSARVVAKYYPRRKIGEMLLAYATRIPRYLLNSDYYGIYGDEEITKMQEDTNNGTMFNRQILPTPLIMFINSAPFTRLLMYLVKSLTNISYVLHNVMVEMIIVTSCTLLIQLLWFGYERCGVVILVPLIVLIPLGLVHLFIIEWKYWRNVKLVIVPLLASRQAKANDDIASDIDASSSHHSSEHSDIAGENYSSKRLNTADHEIRGKRRVNEVLNWIDSMIESTRVDNNNLNRATALKLMYDLSDDSYSSEDLNQSETNSNFSDLSNDEVSGHFSVKKTLANIDSVLSMDDNDAYDDDDADDEISLTARNISSKHVYNTMADIDSVLSMDDNDAYDNADDDEISLTARNMRSKHVYNTMADIDSVLSMDENDVYDNADDDEISLTARNMRAKHVYNTMADIDSVLSMDENDVYDNADDDEISLTARNISSKHVYNTMADIDSVLSMDDNDDDEISLTARNISSKHVYNTMADIDSVLSMDDNDAYDNDDDEISLTARNMTSKHRSQIPSDSAMNTMVHSDAVLNSNYWRNNAYDDDDNSISTMSTHSTRMRQVPYNNDGHFDTSRHRNPNSDGHRGHFNPSIHKRYQRINDIFNQANNVDKKK
jgi:hypothetical protein